MSETFSYLMHGDCLELMKQIPNNYVDLTVTSPPYDNLRQYKGYSFDFEGIAKELFRVTKDGGAVVWVVADATVNGSETGTSFRQALYFKECGFNLYDTMIWLKPSPSAPTEGRYYAVFEYMFVFSKGKPSVLNLLTDRPNKSAGIANKCRKENRSCAEDRVAGDFRVIKDFSRRFNVWPIAMQGKGDTGGHVAVFPEAIPRDHILSWSNPGDTVLDPFLGSGTTGKMAKQLGRSFIGIEIAEEYFAIAKRRIEETPLPLQPSADGWVSNL